MAQRKKLQVFVSSTYTDLQEERQAAVATILTAGHIPAGMELFTAGDESQMQVIFDHPSRRVTFWSPATQTPKS